MPDCVTPKNSNNSIILESMHNGVRITGGPLRLVFGRFRSWLNGKIMQIKLPSIFRTPILNLFAKTVGIKVCEAEREITSYASISDFFSRKLKPGIRTASSNLDSSLVSPVDGVLVASTCINNLKDSRVPQVKGANYCLKSFIGEHDMTLTEGKNLWTLVMYLSPGDYHHFHSPTVYSIEASSHFEGEVYPINPLLARIFENLFCVQERVVLKGSWYGGVMHYAAVAAYNVGDIRLSFDEKLRTNRRGQLKRKYTSSIRRKASCGNIINEKFYYDPTPKSSTSSTSDSPESTKPSSLIHMQHVDEIGEFRMGSTVVLIFEADQSFELVVGDGSRLEVGDLIGRHR